MPSSPPTLFLNITTNVYLSLYSVFPTFDLLLDSENPGAVNTSALFEVPS